MLTLWRRIKSKCRIAFYRLFPKYITIGKKVYFENDVYLDIRYKGKIIIDDYVVLDKGVTLLPMYGHISIGAHTKISPYTIIHGPGKGVNIGKNGLIAGHCLFISANHNFNRTDIPITEQKENSKGITLEDDVWVGAGCRILDGVTIGEGSIIGAGSVVNKSIPPYSIAVGVPAKVIKSRK